MLGSKACLRLLDPDSLAHWASRHLELFLIAQLYSIKLNCRDGVKLLSMLTGGVYEARMGIRGADIIRYRYPNTIILKSFRI